MVGPKLMSHFMGYQINIERIALWCGEGTVGTALAIVNADRADKTGIAVQGIILLIEQMADIIVILTDDVREGVLYLIAQSPGVRSDKGSK